MMRASSLAFIADVCATALVEHEDHQDVTIVVPVVDHELPASE